MNENIEAHILAGVGAVKGLYDIYKPTNLEERIERAGLLVFVGTVAVGGYALCKHIKQMHEPS